MKRRKEREKREFMHNRSVVIEASESEGGREERKNEEKRKRNVRTGKRGP
jgi:hypothetical protein